MKRDNQKLAESCKRLKDENKDLLQKVKELESSKHDLGVKLAQNTHQLDKTNTFLEKLTRSVISLISSLKSLFLNISRYYDSALILLKFKDVSR